MPISVKTTPKNTFIKVRALDSPTFRQDRDALAKIINGVPQYEIDEDGDLSFHHWQFPGDQIEDLMVTWEEKDILPEDEHTQKLMQDWKLSNTPIDLLPKIEGELWKSLDGKVPYDFQEDCVRISRDKLNLIISFDPGLGKTGTSLWRYKLLGSPKMLIICPKRLKGNWQKHIRNTLGEESLIYWGTPKERVKLREQIPNYNIVIATFESNKELCQLNLDWGIVLIDEIHILAGAKAQITKAANMVLRHNEKAHKWGLTGTPIRMDITDLYQILKLLDPTFAGRKAAFCKRFRKVLKSVKVPKYTKAGELYYFHKPLLVSSKNDALLKKKLDCILVRQSREGIIDYDNFMEIVYVDMGSRQRKLYNQVREEIREQIKEGASNPMTLMLRLLQICEGAYTLFDYPDSAKMDYLLEELKDFPDEKACIWFRFLPGTKILQGKLAKSVLYTGNESEDLKNLAVWSFNGVDNEEDRAEFYRLKEKHKFPLELEEANYLIGTYNLRSGMGIDLEKARLNYYMSYDPSPASFLQSRDRVIRLTQTKDTFTRALVCGDTGEPQAVERILTRIKNAASLLDGKGSQQVDVMSDLLDFIREAE